MTHIFDFSTQGWRQVWDPVGNNGPDGSTPHYLRPGKRSGRSFAEHDDTAIGPVTTYGVLNESMQWVAHRSGDTGAGAGCGFLFV